MKLVAIARVKNELDIIEAFVRHHAQHFDKLIVLDDGSSDGTYQILQQLRSVYRDLVVLRQPTIGYMQAQYMTLLLRMAVDKFGADWVAPLDADEFIEPADGLLLGQALVGCQPAVYRLRWSNFVWSPDLEQSKERNPVLRQRFRLPPRLDRTKLLVHAQFVGGVMELTLGSHALMDSGLPVPTQPLDRVQLCHYPVRSVAQYVGKIAVGYLQYLATPDWNRATGFQYIKPFQQLAEFDLHGITTLMREDSLFYSVDELERAKDNLQAVEAPLNYLGGPVTLKTPEGLVLPKVLRHAEMMATEFAGNVKKSRDFDRVSNENAFLQKRLSDLKLELLNSQEKATHQLSELRAELLNSQEKAVQQARKLSELELELLNLQAKASQQARQLQSRTFRALTRVHGMLIRAKILRPRV